MASEAHTTSSVRQLRQRTQLSDEVAAILRHKIMTAEYLPGRRIRMDETAAELGVSVTPVREALLTLRGEGMVHLAPHRGYDVAELSRSDVEDLFWLQGQAARRIASRTAATISADDITDLEWANRQLRDAISTGNPHTVSDAEFNFHRTHNRISGANKLAWFLLAMTRYTPHMMYASDPDWAAVTLDSHSRLIEAYRAGDADGAAEQIARQFADGAQRLITHLETTPIWQNGESSFPH